MILLLAVTLGFPRLVCSESIVTVSFISKEIVYNNYHLLNWFSRCYLLIYYVNLSLLCLADEPARVSRSVSFHSVHGYILMMVLICLHVAYLILTLIRANRTEPGIPGVLLRIK